MKEATSIKQLFQSMTGGETALIIGTVSKASPLEITADGDEKHIISEELLVIPEHLTDHETEITITEDYDWKTEEASSHRHKIIQEKKKVMIHGKLKKGDEVALLALAHGKHYFVLDRM